MAELVITPASVISGANPTLVKDYVAGETITAGMAVYHLASDSKWYMAQNDNTAAQSGSGPLVGPGGVGVATHAALAGQPLVVQTGGTITIGAAILVGVHYFVGPTFGGIGVAADIASGKYMTRIGYGITTAIMQLDIKASGLQLA